MLRSSRVRHLSFLLGAVFVLLIVLPAVHEFGHYLPGVLFGAEVRSVTWTLLAGSAPKVSFRSVTETALPWVDAGGILFPTGLGMVLTGIWARFYARFRSGFWLLLLFSGVGLSFNALGAAIEAFGPAASSAHLRGLAHHFGLSGGAAVGFQLIPTLLITPVLYYALTRFRHSAKLFGMMLA